MLILLLLCTLLGCAQACKEADNCHCLESSAGKFVRAWRGPDGKRDWYVDIAPHCRDNEHWLFEEKNGKISLKSDDGMYLLAHPNGTLYLSLGTSAPEMWNTERNEDGSWSFHVDGRWLSAHLTEDTVDTMPHNLDWERFRIHSLALFNAKREKRTSPAEPEEPETTTTAFAEPEPELPLLVELGGGRNADVVIRTASYGKFLLGRPKECVFCLKPANRSVVFAYVKYGQFVEDAEHWRIEQRGDKVVLIAHHGEFLRGWKWVGVVEKEEPSVLWKPVKNEDDGTWSFQSHDGEWLTVAVSATSNNNAAITVKNVEESARFKINSWKSRAAQASGHRMIRSAAHKTYLRASANRGKVDMITDPPKMWERWYIQEEDGTVVLRSIHTPSRFLSGCPNGTVGLVGKPQEREHWEPFKNADGSWSLLNINLGWLKADADGQVTTVKEREGLETSFFLLFWTDLVLPPYEPTGLTAAAEVAGQRRFLSATHGTYLLQKGGRQQGVEMGEREPSRESWFIKESEGKVIIKIGDKRARYLRDSTNGVLNLVSYARKWEHWTAVKNPDGSFSFQSAHGRWLSAGSNGAVKTSKFQGLRQQFWMEPWN